MLRRTCYRWATKAAVTTSNSLAGTSGGELSEGDPSRNVSNFFGKVEVASTPVTGEFAPPASERPDLLQSYTEPKPFISARNLQLFTVSLGVGVATMTVIYFLLSKSISENLEAQQLELDEIAAKNKKSLQDREKILREFSAPSSFDDIKKKMELYDKEMERNEKALQASTSALHSEVLYRVKTWWNTSITNLQDATLRMSKAIEKRQDNAVEYNIHAVLKKNGYQVVNLERQ